MTAMKALIEAAEEFSRVSTWNSCIDPDHFRRVKKAFEAAIASAKATEEGVESKSEDRSVRIFPLAHKIIELLDSDPDSVARVAALKLVLAVPRFKDAKKAS